MDDETPRVSDRTTESLLREMLGAISKMLDGAADSPLLRELEARARSYEEIVSAWTTAPPSAEQRDATFDRVVELHTEIVAVKGHRGAAPRSRRE